MFHRKQFIEKLNVLDQKQRKCFEEYSENNKTVELQLNFNKYLNDNEC